MFKGSLKLTCLPSKGLMLLLFYFSTSYPLFHEFFLWDFILIAYYRFAVPSRVCWASVLNSVCWAECAEQSVLSSVCWAECADHCVLSGVCWAECAEQRVVSRGIERALHSSESRIWGKYECWCKASLCFRGKTFGKRQDFVPQRYWTSSSSCCIHRSVSACYRTATSDQIRLAQNIRFIVWRYPMLQFRPPDPTLSILLVLTN